jgi:GTP 3',8-cyclase
LEQLLLKLKRIDGLKTLALTTNGTCLADKAQLLRDAGLDQLTVSLDSVDALRFEELSQRPLLAETLQGIAKARAVGFETIKLDTVATLAQSDEDLLMLLDFAWKNRIQPRLIEYMDVGGATAWRPELVRSRQQLLAVIEARHGVAAPLPGRGAAPAEMFRLPGGQIFGIIASVSQPFCGDCDRARLTANGLWLNCLYAEQGHDLKQLLRSGASDGRIVAAMRQWWQGRWHRSAEQRQLLQQRAALVPVERLRREPHLEMHTRGG